MRFVALCALSMGCRFMPGAASDDAAVIDAPVTSPDAPDAAAPPDAPPVCYGVAPVMVCLDAAPTTPYTGGDLVIATAAAPCRTDVSTPSDNSLCVVAYTDVLIDTVLNASGPRPLVVIASGNMTVKATATIDVASHIGGTPQAIGPGANPLACNPATAGGPESGGAGGSFGGQGGNGADPIGTATSAGNTLAPNSLIGGCAGTDGLPAASSANHGNGGGSIALIVVNMLTIDGTINASGSAGGGGKQTNAQGGGGGGTGGMISLQAATLAGANTGLLLSAGAAGGEGGENDADDMADGSAGSEPTLANLSTGAPGGTNGTEFAGDGGRGSDPIKPAGAPGDPGTATAGGGGGGGGGRGYIFITAPTDTFLGAKSPISQ